MLLVGPKANRHRQAWLILVPLGLVMAVWQMPFRLFSIPSSGADNMGFFITAGAMAWTVLGLIGHWLARLPRLSKFLAAFGTMIAVAVVSHGCDYGIGGLPVFGPSLVMYVILAFVPVMAMGLSGFSCRRHYSPRRLMGWLAPLKRW